MRSNKTGKKWAKYVVHQREQVKQERISSRPVDIHLSVKLTTAQVVCPWNNSAFVFRISQNVSFFNFWVRMVESLRYSSILFCNMHVRFVRFNECVFESYSSSSQYKSRFLLRGWPLLSVNAGAWTVFLPLFACVGAYVRGCMCEFVHAWAFVVPFDSSVYMV